MFVRVVRSATLAIAADAGLSIDQSEELALATDEACNVLIDARAVELLVEFVQHDQLDITIRPAQDVDLQMDTVSELILTTMTECASISAEGTISLRKQTA